jgi:hypothetical protein
MIGRLEAGIPAKYKMNLTAEDKTKYQKMLRDGRMDMTKRGIYDPAMMSVLKKPVARWIKPTLNAHWAVSNLPSVIKESSV